jgi:hypothetical protein
LLKLLPPDAVPEIVPDVPGGRFTVGQLVVLTARGYAADSNENRAKERIWFSPHCLRPEDGHRKQITIDFGELKECAK